MVGAPGVAGNGENSRGWESRLLTSRLARVRLRQSTVERALAKTAAEPTHGTNGYGDERRAHALKVCRLGKRRLCYLAEGERPDLADESPEAQAKLAAFKRGIGRDLVRGTFRSPDQLQGLVATDMHRVLAGEPLGFDRGEVSRRLQAHAERFAANLDVCELESRPRLVSSPATLALRSLFKAKPWHEQQRTSLEDLALAAKGITDLGDLSARARAAAAKMLSPNSYPELTKELNELTGDQAFSCVLEWQRRRSRQVDPLDDDRAGRIRSILSHLQTAAEHPEYRKCLLVTGSLGAGKTHFLASVLANSSDELQLLIPLGPPRSGVSIEAAALHAVAQALGHGPNHGGGFRSLWELDQLLGSPVVGIEIRPLLLLAMDELESWIRFHPNFLDELKRAIAELSQLKSVAWLLLINHQDIDCIAGRGKFFDTWGTLGNRKQDRGAQMSRRDWPLLPNIGGWVDLDTLNTDAKVGLRIIDESLRNEDPGRATSIALGEDPTAGHHFALPFTAWMFVEAWRLEARQGGDYRFIGFVQTFWSRRREALERSLADTRIRKVPVFLDNLVTGIAEHVLRTGELAPQREALRTDLLESTWAREHARASQALDDGLRALATAGLLRDVPMERDGYTLSCLRLGFEVFWEFHLARRLATELQASAEDPAVMLARIQERLAGFPASSIREGVLAFLLLLLDQSTEGDASHGPIVALWMKVAREARLPRASVWFAGAQASAAVQRSLLDLARDEHTPPDTHTTLALMYFVRGARDADLGPAQRLSLLQPHLRMIAGTGLGQYYRYVAEVEIERCASRDAVVDCMMALIGCELTDEAEALGQLCARILVERTHDDFESAVTAMWRFLADYPKRQRPEQAKRGYYFGEHVLEGFCAWVVEAKGVRALEMLREHRWYHASAHGIIGHIEIWMSREANIALGHWSHRADDHELAEYSELVESLASSRSSTDVDAAFFLIRHSAPTYGKAASHVHSRFHDILRGLVLSPRLSEELLRIYSPMLELNLPDYGTLLKQRQRLSRHGGRARPGRKYRGHAH